jgi:hypothetical protein
MGHTDSHRGRRLYGHRGLVAGITTLLFMLCSPLLTQDRLYASVLPPRSFSLHRPPIGDLRRLPACFPWHRAEASAPLRPPPTTD